MLGSPAGRESCLRLLGQSGILKSCPPKLKRKASRVLYGESLENSAHEKESRCECQAKVAQPASGTSSPGSLSLSLPFPSLPSLPPSTKAPSSLVQMGGTATAPGSDVASGSSPPETPSTSSAPGAEPSEAPGVLGSASASSGTRRKPLGGNRA